MNYYLWIPDNSSNRKAFLSGTQPRITVVDDHGDQISDNCAHVECPLTKWGICTVTPFNTWMEGDSIRSANGNCGTGYTLRPVVCRAGMLDVFYLSGWIAAKAGLAPGLGCISTENLGLIDQYIQDHLS